MPESQSVKKPKRRKTRAEQLASLTVTQTLEVLQQAASDYQERAGIDALKILAMPERGGVALFLPGVTWCAEHGVLTVGTCRKCQNPLTGVV